jgi:hypothetical protein
VIYFSTDFILTYAMVGHPLYLHQSLKDGCQLSKNTEFVGAKKRTVLNILLVSRCLQVLLLPCPGSRTLAVNGNVDVESTAMLTREP